MSNQEEQKRELLKNIIQNSVHYKSEAGKAIFADLKQEFKKVSVAAPTAHETIIRAAQYDVLDYIGKMINVKLGEDE